MEGIPMKNKFGLGILLGIILGSIVSLSICFFILQFQIEKKKKSDSQIISSNITISETKSSSPTAIKLNATAISKSSQLFKPKEWAKLNELSISLEGYELANKCQGYGDGPAEGAKLVYVWIVVRNDSDDVIDVPSFYVNITGIKDSADRFGGLVCRYDDKSLGNACWKNRGKLYPHIECRGWELFEVPVKFNVEGKTLTIAAKSNTNDTLITVSWLL